MINSGGKSPAIVFKYISSALLGKEAYTGGTGIVIMGILLHMLIATIFAAIFYLLYKNIEWISKNILLIHFQQSNPPYLLLINITLYVLNSNINKILEFNRNMEMLFTRGWNRKQRSECK